MSQSKLVAKLMLVDGAAISFDDAVGLLAAHGYENTSENPNMFYPLQTVEDFDDAVHVNHDVNQIHVFGSGKIVSELNGILRRCAWTSCDVEIVDSHRKQIETALKVVLIRKCTLLDETPSLDEFIQRTIANDLQLVGNDAYPILDPIGNDILNIEIEPSNDASSNLNGPETSSTLSEIEIDEIVQENVRANNKVEELMRKVQLLEEQLQKGQSPLEGRNNSSILAAVQLSAQDEVDVLQVVLEKQILKFIESSSIAKNLQSQGFFVKPTVSIFK